MPIRSQKCAYTDAMVGERKSRVKLRNVPSEERAREAGTREAVQSRAETVRHGHLDDVAQPPDLD
jgi:hypothetical protein